MRTIALADIRALEPCYDPAIYLPEDWKGTVIDILNLKDASPKDRLWVACHDKFCSEKTLRLFAVRCARDALSLVKNPDPRSLAVCDVAEKFANGNATKEELAEVRAGAWSVVWAVEAARAAAREAALAAWAAARATGVAAEATAWAARVAAWGAGVYVCAVEKSALQKYCGWLAEMAKEEKE